MLSQLKELIRKADNNFVVSVLNSYEEIQKDILDLVIGNIEQGKYSEIDDFFEAICGIEQICEYMFDKKMTMTL